MLSAATQTYFANMSHHKQQRHNAFYSHSIQSPPSMAYQFASPPQPQPQPHPQPNQYHQYKSPTNINHMNSNNDAMSSVHNSNHNGHMDNDTQSVIDSQLEAEGTVQRKISDNVALPMSDNLNNSNIAVQEHRDSIPESPALPDSPGFNHIDEQQQIKNNFHYSRHRHRKSFHMTPSGFMGQKFVPKKHHKKSVTTDQIPNIFKRKQHQMLDTNHEQQHGEIETLKLEQKREHKKTGSGLTFITYYDEKKEIDAGTHLTVNGSMASLDVDKIEFASETLDDSNLDIKSPEDDDDNDPSPSNTDDLSRELFSSASRSEQQHQSQQNMFYPMVHHQKSLPVILSPNNRMYAEHGVHKESLDDMDVFSNNYNDNAVPMPLRNMTEQHGIAPLKEYSESTYTEITSDLSEISKTESGATRVTHHRICKHAKLSQIAQTDADDEYTEDSNNNTVRIKRSQHTYSRQSDFDSETQTHSLESHTLTHSESEEYQTTVDDEYDYKYGHGANQIKYKHVQRHSHSDDEDDDDGLVAPSTLFLDVGQSDHHQHKCQHHRDNRKFSLSSLIPSLPEDNESETSVQQQEKDIDSIDNEIILHHTMKLMDLVPDSQNLRGSNNDNYVD